MLKKWRRPPPGKMAQLFQQRGRVDSPGVQPSLSFSNLTPDEYAAQLKAEGVSEKFIAAEVETLVEYQAKVNAERERFSATRRKRLVDIEEAAWIQDYLKADERRKARTQERKVEKDA